MRFLLAVVGLCALGATTRAQYAPATTPVPILKQINRHNEDGSYSYGYEAADGSYKIESKYPSGEVYGKYGFLDDTGSLREIEYGASRRGFEPKGTDINVPPPTIHGNGLPGAGPAGKAEPDDNDDGQYREDPSVYYTDPRYTNGERYEPEPKRAYALPGQQQQPRPFAYSQPSKSVAAAYRAPPPAAPAPAPAQHHYQQQYQPQYQPQYQSQYQPQYQQQYQQAATYPQSYNAAPSRLAGHPASNVDLNLGSYSVRYRR